MSLALLISLAGKPFLPAKLALNEKHLLNKPTKEYFKSYIHV